MKTTTFFVSVLCLAAEAIYFAHRNPELCLHIPSESGTIVGKVYAFPNVNDGCVVKTNTSHMLTYDVTGESAIFETNSTGFIILRTPLPDTATGPVILKISASCPNGEGNVISTDTAVTVNFHRTQTDSQLTTNQIIPDKSTVDRICFSHISKNSTLSVEENIKDVVLGRLNTCWDDDKYERSYMIEKPKSRFSIDPVTSEVRLIKQLDRESLGDNKGQPDSSFGIQPLKITCEVKIDGVTYTSERHRLNVTVLDVNDNPPRFHRHNGSQNISKNVEIQNDTSYQPLKDVEEVVEDADADSGNKNNVHEIKVISDDLNVCEPSLHCLSVKLAKTVCRLRIHLQNIDTITATLYKCEVAVVDTKFKHPTDKSIKNSATIVINVHKPSFRQPTAMLETKQVITFYRNATRLARLYELETDHGTKTRYALRDAIFRVTPKTGIIYVNNTETLSVAPDMYALIVRQSGGPSITINVLLEGRGRTTSSSCGEGCSRHDSARSCNGSCGLGLADGSCLMRGSDNNKGMTKDYGTCTHETSTCPDLVCDELEDLYPQLCPQDCTLQSDISGAFLINTNQDPHRGIAMAQSPCWCEADYGCYCMPPHSSEPPESRANLTLTHKTVESAGNLQRETEKQTTSKLSTDAVARYGLEKTSAVIQQPVTHSENGTFYTDSIALASDQSPVCDKLCGVAIGIGLTMFLLISFSLFMLWFTKKKNDRRKTNMKHVGSVISISGLPSDYQEERERRLSYSSDHWSQKGPIYSTQIQHMHDDSERWEIPREALTLEKTLGEGEFGLVVKARLAGTDGDHNVRNVAVKMLKHCSTQLEEQDLLSEFNLLKDVSHPNVVRLIGACTSGGPFYLVVEYCQHGCLLKYLRRSRLEENGYVNSGTRFKSPNLKEQTDQDLTGDLLSMRDLLSFAWQIAKGMSYLSEIKLVHRDLAARNILVASGKLLKISDFGLTRDVYEADTYLKKSKGRIPVKWLAPESLYAQIYTTRSDIWSYGIVMWELVTLGAPPYPGIPPERLYNLLIGGYRMDKPENCPDEMYAVMQKCWKIDAADRPSFATLAIIFDRILQEKTGYLDLSRNNVHVSDLYNKCFNSSLSEKQDDDENEPVITNDTNGEDSTEKVNIFTVCNETYNSDNYLVPTPSSSHQSSDSDHFLPLLETRVTELGDSGNAKIDNCCEDMGSNVQKTELDVYDARRNDKVRLDEHRESVMKEENVKVNEHKRGSGSAENNGRPNNNSLVITSRRGQEQMFKKKSENALPTIRYTKNNKNKHVIYPSENVALLTESGNARCVRDNDSNEHETSRC